MVELNLCDIYRIQHIKRFTWHNRGRGGWVQSRLDMFLVSDVLNYSHIKSNKYPSIKFNTKLLQDTEFVEK